MAIGASVATHNVPAWLQKLKDAINSEDGLGYPVELLENEYFDHNTKSV